MLQSTYMDLTMDDDELSTTNNGKGSNGFMDPRILNQFNELDLPESTELESQDGSQQSSDDDKIPVDPRRAFLPTGVYYDVRMRLHANADFTESPHHPEDPRRIEAIFNAFKEAGLIYAGPTVELHEKLKHSPYEWMWRISSRYATREEICTVHTASHWEWVMSLREMSSESLRQLTRDFDTGRKSLYVGNLTHEAALISAGGAIETCKNVVAGKIKNGIAVIRPPGHHAEHNEALGFCIFNNVPIAAKVCMADYPKLCRKVLILDWDVHHGNGIQNMFYEDPNVLYISIHVYKNGIFYPGQPEDPGVPDGGLENCGAGRGLGKNINIGWAEQGVGNGEYMAAFQRIVMPIAHEFDPDLVIVSAGFDAAAGDDLGGCYVTPACYSHMTHMLMSLADGKVAVCLEGGYNLKAISMSALAVAKTLMGDPPDRMAIPPLNKTAQHTLANVKRIQSAYWECMRPGVVSLADLQERSTDRLSDMIRTAQKSSLSERHGMFPLYVMRTKLSRSFENQVLVTPNIDKAKRILMVIHDPPEVLAQPDPYNNHVYAHNAFVTDGLMPYIDWAIKHGFGVMDINIPQHISDVKDTDPWAEKASETKMAEQLRTLLCYLWDNYFELNPDASLTLMGIGDAYFGIKQLLISRPTTVNKVTGILCFVTGTLRPVKSETDPSLSKWYKANTLLYVSPDHACFADEASARRVRKERFGRVVEADIVVGKGDGVGKMLRRHESDSQSWIKKQVKEWERLNVGSESESDGEGNKIEGVKHAEEMDRVMRDVPPKPIGVI
ncbi:related to histone deacetylase A [Rhynchosporium graminicola]|uniref:Histone deacetylase n=1 Tax=Rhynchosporium graminicola TaxID=2792576 RepID=A0A1E1LL03_9HELO|nr:related to histone deacetylase A [Rhynchosporium commune]